MNLIGRFQVSEFSNKVKENYSISEQRGIGTTVYHKDYGKGKVAKLNENKVYIDFDGKQRIFPFPEAFEKGYLKSDKDE